MEQKSAAEERGGRRDEGPVWDRAGEEAGAAVAGNISGGWWGETLPGVMQGKEPSPRAASLVLVFLPDARR